MVVLDKKDYIEKAQELLAQSAYRIIEMDPINKLKAKLITILRKIKRDTGMEENLYKGIHPTGCTLKILWFAQTPQNRHPTGLLYWAGVQVFMGWQKSLLRYLDHWQVIHPIIYKVLGTLLTK